MPATAVVDAQWGDGGKGKIIDYIARFIDLGVRGNGGGNAGHSVFLDRKEIVLHMIPTCVVNGKKAAIGRGCVVNPTALTEEVQYLHSKGIRDIDLMIDERAHVITPQHLEKDGTDTKIGTTRRGIGPCYASKAAREGIRMIDYADENPKFREVLGDVSILVNDSLDRGEEVLLEGAQGFGLCIDNGTYHYVTSSNTTVTGLCAGVGISERKLGKTIEVVKAYPTRVGNGPFPTQLGTDKQIESEFPELTVDDMRKAKEGDEYSLGKLIRINGHEYGATTGRKRKTGWFDAVLVRDATKKNRPDEIALTKLDVLSGLEKIEICMMYETENGRTLLYSHADAKVLFKCRPL